MTAADFLALHHRDAAFVIPNPWDPGSARVFAAMGFEALATTSAGFAGTLGRSDGEVSRDEMLHHCELMVAATDLPVSADLENGFGHSPEEVAETVRMAADAGLAGCSIEDFGGPDSGIYAAELAVERVQAAVEAAAECGGIVVTARAENHLRGVQDLDDTIARLQAFEQVGAPVVYAPGPSQLADLSRLVDSVQVPINVLALPGTPSVPELTAIGVKRVSIGSGLAWVALGAAQNAAREFLEEGSYGFWRNAISAADRQTAFGAP